MKASFCSPVLCVLVLNMPFMAWANVLRTQYLIPKGMDRAYVLSVVVGAAVNVAANVALIPRLGALGAAWGTTLAEVAVCVVQVVEVRGMLPSGAGSGRTCPSSPSAPRCSSRCAGSALSWACVSRRSRPRFSSAGCFSPCSPGRGLRPAVTATGSTSSCPCSKGPFRGSAARREHSLAPQFCFSLDNRIGRNQQ